MTTILKLVKDELEANKLKKANVQKDESPNMKDEQAINTNSAYQEIYELTQRKFLKQLTKYCDKMQTSKEYPRLLCIDQISVSKLEEIKSKNNNKNMNLKRRWSISERVNHNLVVKQKTQEDDEILTCVRVLCEHEEGWHPSESLIILPEIIPEYCAYLARIMKIIKTGNLASDLPIFLTSNGEKLISDIENKALSENQKISESYISLRNFFINKCENKHAIVSVDIDDDKDTDLQRCELKNGKILWLCNKHIAETNARILNDANKISTQFTYLMDSYNEKLLQDINKIQIDLIDQYKIEDKETN